MKRFYRGWLAPAALLALCASPAFAATLSGVVTDPQNAPLPHVTVEIPALHRGVVAGQDGRFTLENLPAGVYTIRVSSLGYGAETRKVTLATEDVSLRVVLRISPLEAPGVTVTGKPQPTDALTSPQPVAVVGGRQLERERGETLAGIIEKTPGVSAYTTGAGIAKPVIRGLTSQRVLVLVDGVRQEGQQWGDEHGPEVDALDVDRVEVVRGPNSVLYGSDALGGVVNLIKGDIPSVSDGAPKLGGTLLVNAFSVNRQGAGALSLHGANGGVGYRANLSVRNAGDMGTPSGLLSNSGERQVNGSGLLGARGDWGAVSADFAGFSQRLEIHEDPAENPGFTGYQRVRHQRAHLHADLPASGLRVEVDGGWQRNDRREFEDGGDAAVHLRMDTATLDVKAHHRPLGPMFGTVGFSLMRQRNRTLGEEALIPGFTDLNAAGFLYEEATIRRVTLSGGVRVDRRSMDVADNADLGVPAQKRIYNAVTGTAGLSIRASGPVALAFNVARGWRAPTAFELFIDGVHEGTVRYEIGDSGLKPEGGLNVDASVRVAAPRGHGEISLFHNRIDHFIHSSPTGAVDPASGFGIYRNRQANATLVGAEFAVEAQAATWLVLSAGADLVRGTNDETGGPIPLMPAHRLQLGARVIAAEYGALRDLYFSVRARFVAAQGRVEAFETPTTGYRLFSLGLGAEVPAGPRRASIDIGVENLLNRHYRDHLSRYRAYADDPGRNVTLKLSVPLGR